MIPSVLKYPVVLVHGIAIHDRKEKVDSWGRIPETLRNRGIDVFFGNTDAWGDYDSNAEILKTTIEKVLEQTGREKVNIIAHSKGGIDSRYFVHKYDFGGRVASLTTISSPHHGSEIADLIYRQKITHSGIAKEALKIFSKFYGDENPRIYNLIRQLTTDNMKRFNAEITMDKRVYYQSLYTTINSVNADLLRFFTHSYIRNDGLVSEKSARWGDNIIKIEGEISHNEIIDLKQKNIRGMDIPRIYIDITDELCGRGF
jgi:triacylglycerol lipase